MRWGLDVSHHARISQRGWENLFFLTSSFIGCDRGRDSHVRTESCWNDCLKEEKAKHYQTVCTITRSLRGRSGATTNRSKPSDNVPIPARVASEPRGDGVSASTKWRGPRLNSKVRIHECS